jgi:hypothetical protein
MSNADFVEYFEPQKVYSPHDELVQQFLGTTGAQSQARYANRGPAFLKLGSRVLYSGRDLNDFINARRVPEKGAA